MRICAQLAVLGLVSDLFTTYSINIASENSEIFHWTVKAGMENLGLHWKYSGEVIKISVGNL